MEKTNEKKILKKFKILRFFEKNLKILSSNFFTEYKVDYFVLVTLFWNFFEIDAKLQIFYYKTQFLQFLQKHIFLQIATKRCVVDIF